MFEPITLTVTELAARWNRTPKQILEIAQRLGVPLYFHYGCLAFEETDSWHRSAGDQREVQDREYLTKAIESREEQMIRARDGQLSQWEQLPPGGTPELRKEINTMKSKLRFIDELLEQREVERAQCVLGFLRPGPGTLLDIANNGQTEFPRWVFHSAGKIMTQVVRDERGNPYLEWIGRRMILEPRNGEDPRWRKMLLFEDLFASMDEVKAIEAQSAPAAGDMPPDFPNDSETPAALDTGGAGATVVEPWKLIKPQRWQGYNKPLFEFLERQHAAGRPLPKAVDVLDAFKKNKPHEVITVLVSGLEYYGPRGECKPADLNAITKAIGRIVVKESAD